MQRILHLLFLVLITCMKLKYKILYLRIFVIKNSVSLKLGLAIVLELLVGLIISDHSCILFRLIRF